MSEFVIRYGFCIAFCAAGLFFVVMSYVCARAGRSGVPFVGGVLIAIGFLTTPCKWLALLGLIDYGCWSLPYLLILERVREKRFAAVYAAQGYREGASDDSKLLCITIPERNEVLQRAYITNKIYELRVPKLLFAVCTDGAGNRFLLVDRCIKGGEIEILPFDSGCITLTGCNAKDTEMTVALAVNSAAPNNDGR